MSQPITEAKSTDSRLDLVQKMLASAEEKSAYIANTDVEMSQSTREGFEREIEALTLRAADLIAKYGIDRAMLASTGQEADPVTDKVIFATRPYAQSMQELLISIAISLGAEVRRVRQFDPEDHGGRTKGAWQYGLRLFVHSSDLMRIELLFASVRNQALAGASRIKGTAEFGQDRRAYVINYLNGFSAAIRGRLDRAEKEAQDAAEAERLELADKALLAGSPSTGHSVELVLADRKSALRRTMDAADGISPEKRAELERNKTANRARWAEMDKQAQERRDAHRKSHETCERCKSTKSGYCRDHQDLRPVQGRAYRESVGADFYYTGHQDGQRADLGIPSDRQVGNSGQRELS
jgi:hypothetical protein